MRKQFLQFCPQTKIQKTMKRNSYALKILMVFLIHSCGIKTAKEVQLKFSTEKSKLPESLNWNKIGFDKELFNQVRSQYGNDDEFIMNASVLWILRSLDDNWKDRFNALI